MSIKVRLLVVSGAVVESDPDPEIEALLLCRVPAAGLRQLRTMQRHLTRDGHLDVDLGFAFEEGDDIDQPAEAAGAVS